MRLRTAAWLIAAVLTGALTPARADPLVLSLSKPTVAITSSFTGEELVLFGVIEPAASTYNGPYDVVVTVRGPAEDFATWRKERRLGLWTNVDSRVFLGVPSYLAVLSNRPATDIADADIRRQEQIGLTDNHFLQRIGGDYADVVRGDPFRQAFLRVKQAQHLYYERADGVSFIAPRVFRASIPIPGIAPVGRYEVAVKVFAAGEMTRRSGTSFTVAKTDFEQSVAKAAHEHAWLYGLVTALGSVLVGFVAHLAFRKD